MLSAREVFGGTSPSQIIATGINGNAAHRLSNVVAAILCRLFRHPKRVDVPTSIGVDQHLIAIEAVSERFSVRVGRRTINPVGIGTVGRKTVDLHMPVKEGWFADGNNLRGLRIGRLIEYGAVRLSWRLGNSEKLTPFGLMVAPSGCGRPGLVESIDEVIPIVSTVLRLWTRRKK